MGYTDYLSRINQTNLKYSWNKKNTKYILNVLYNDQRVYGSEKYKNLMEGLIQIPYGKVDPGEISYQAVCKETRKEIGLYTALVYLTIDKEFNCDLYITNIRKRILQ